MRARILAGDHDAAMTARARHPLLRSLASHGTLNFWLTNAIPRRTLTLLVGWISRIENPVV
jgi:hypothetical protein